MASTWIIPTSAADSLANLGVSFPITADKGGTGLTSIPLHNVVVGNGSSTITTIAPGSTGTVLKSTGPSSAPNYDGTPIILSNASNTATNLDSRVNTNSGASAVAGYQTTNDGGATAAFVIKSTTNGGAGNQNRAYILTNSLNDGFDVRLDGDDTKTMRWIINSSTRMIMTKEALNATSIAINAKTLNQGYQTRSTTGTVTLTAASPQQQFFTGGAATTVVLPDTSTLVLGQTFTVGNRQTGGFAITVQSSALNTIGSTIPAGASQDYTVVDIATNTAASWDIAVAALTADLKGTLAVTQGGTGLATVTPFAVPIGNGTSTFNLATAGPVGSVLKSTGPSSNPNFDGTPIILSTTTAGATLDVRENLSANADALTGYKALNNAGVSVTLQVTSSGATTASEVSLISSSAAHGIHLSALGTGKHVAFSTDSIERVRISDTLLDASTITTKANTFVQGYELHAGVTGGTQTMTASQPQHHRYTGTGGTATLRLPDVTTLTLGQSYLITNSMDSGTIAVRNFANTGQIGGSIPFGAARTYYVIDISTDAVASWSSSAVGLGTDTKGILAVANGGTGLSTWTQKGIVFASNSATLTNTASGSLGTVLLGKGTTVDPIFSTSGATGAVFKANSSADPSWLARGTTGQVLTATATDIQWSTPAVSATPVSAPTPGTPATWDANSNFTANNFLKGTAQTAVSASVVTLTTASPGKQFYTGSVSDQEIRLPAVATLVVGQAFDFTNNSTKDLIIKTTGGTNLVVTIIPNSSLILTCISTASDAAASWNGSFSSGSGTGPTIGGPPTTSSFVNVVAAGTSGISTKVAFHITTAASTASIGAVYSDTVNNYTVLSGFSGNGNTYLFTDNSNPPIGSGTLTKQSGTGTTSLAYNHVKHAYQLPTPRPKYLKLKVVGGGGGGSGGNYTDGNPATAGSNGATFTITSGDTVALITCTGGAGGAINTTGSPSIINAASGTVTTHASVRVARTYIDGVGSLGGSNGDNDARAGGGFGGSTPLGQGCRVGNSASQDIRSGCGGGGQGGAAEGTNKFGSGGGAGGYFEGYIVNPDGYYALSIADTLGTGGTKGIIGSFSANAQVDGAPGVGGGMFVEEFYT